MASENLVVQFDPDDDDNPDAFLRTHPVTSRIDVPPKAQSKGWGDMSWVKRRRR